jgi:U2-associated protein SR140
VELTDLKSKTFSHGITKKTKKDLEREAEEKKRLDEERSVCMSHRTGWKPVSD